MKSILTYLSFLIFTTIVASTAYCQENLHQLVTKINKDKLGNMHEYWNKVQLASDDTVINRFFQKYDSIMFDSISEGAYVIKLTSVFNHTLSGSVSIDKNDTTQEIYFDKVKDYYKILKGDANFCQSMEVSDTLIILFNEQGSFHKHSGKIVLIKGDDSWTAQLCDYKEGKIIKQRQISSALIINVLKFEKKLNSHRDREKCNTIAYCSLQFKKQVKRIEDRTCSWDEYNKLEKLLFE